MKRFFCCFKGEGSGTAVEAHQLPDDRGGSGTAVQAPQLPDVRGGSGTAVQVRQLSDVSGGSGTAVQAPQLPDDAQDPFSFLNHFPSSPPLPENCAESMIPWQAIVDGTVHFRETLGRGNFGKVYRCDFPSIRKVGAAKIQASTNLATHLEFIAEVTMLHEADHPNVIKLLGQCYETLHRALIYEFMPNGSLDHYLTDPRPGKRTPHSPVVLDWETRMRIAVGVVKGLAYVHMRLKAVHRDIKAGNILLDQNFEPKLSDFGLAIKIVEGEGGIEKESMVDILKGTRGCIAPETREYGNVTTKSDVYSYGVLLLQLFTGEKAFDWERPDETRHLADWFLSVWSPTENHRRVLPDVALRKKFSAEGFKKVLNTAWVCVGADPHSRPDMKVVGTMIVEAAACPTLEVSTASSST